ncbi:hypothetical protein [Nitrosospira sp. Is2]|uniref:hypothetical protein n=1 Tax=Nitrosospira sp. Is2 TaxID=3080532 RepID=UPI0029544C93|nr:hypothetical protein [Nitrosospira sp. Is2]WON74622.1 hypothetical protein R5L00_03800 [Nitrosospira sp. Is2]
MTTSSKPREIVPDTVSFAVGLTFSIAGLIMVLAAPLVYAQSAPMGDSGAGQAPSGEYKRGETPTGQEYGVIKKGEPHKSDAAGKKSDRSNHNHHHKGDAKSDGGLVDRDKRETQEGSRLTP